MRRNPLLLIAPALLIAGCVERESPTAPNAPASIPFHLSLTLPSTPPGMLVVWGDDSFGQRSTVPPGNDFIAVAAGASHSVALRSNGTLVSWGGDLSGQVSNTPAGNNFVAVAAGYYHSIALRSDGSLVSWGRNNFGEVTSTPAGNDFIAIAAASWHSVALRADGSLTAWGYNGLGNISATPTGTGFARIGAGNWHNMAIRTDGSLVAWGYNNYVVGMPSGNDYVAVDGGDEHSVALRANGSLANWGDDDDDGLLSDTPTTSDFKAVTVGSDHMVALRTNGTLVAWGSNAYGQVSTTPTGDGFIAVSGGDHHSVAIRTPDLTPPVITPTITGPSGAPGWYIGDVTVSWTVADPESAISAQTGCDITIITTDTNGTTLTCEATSAGGTASRSVTIKRDATRPTLTPAVSPDPVLLNGEATAVPNAVDNTAGILGSSCGVVNTTSVGSKTVSCGAIDRAGNTAGTFLGYYTVQYAFTGFSGPIDNNGVLNVAKAGQMVPLKWRLADAQGQPITTLSGVSVTVQSLACASGTVQDAVEEYAPGSSGLQNLGDGYYQFNWRTDKSYAGSCKTMHLNLGEGITRTALFEFRK